MLLVVVYLKSINSCMWLNFVYNQRENFARLILELRMHIGALELGFQNSPTVNYAVMYAEETNKMQDRHTSKGESKGQALSIFCRPVSNDR